MTASFCSRHLLAILATAIALTLSHLAVATENPLQAHRDRAAQKAFDAVQVKTVVVQTVGDDQLMLAIPPSQIKGVSFESGDHARIHLAGKTLETRFITQDGYDQLMRDPALRATLDVDVLCLLDAAAQPGNLLVVGLGGGLVTWLNAKPGMSVLIEWQKK